MKESVLRGLDIVRVYRIATGESAPAARRGEKRSVRVRCPVTTHADAHPSCDLYLDKRAWRCHTCGSSGGILKLIVAAGHAHSPAEAAHWLELELKTSL